MIPAQSKTSISVLAAVLLVIFTIILCASLTQDVASSNELNARAGLIVISAILTATMFGIVVYSIVNK